MNRSPVRYEKPKLIDQIVAAKRKELLAKRAQQPLDLLRKRIEHQPPPLSLATALSRPGQHLIAEVAAASPVRGSYAISDSPGKMAAHFMAAGVAAISVVTESRYFGGGISDLMDVCQTALCPVIRRDFVVHTYQVYESRAYGADALFLIAALLTTAQIEELTTACARVDMDAIIEVHTGEDLYRVQGLRPRLICLNNWRVEDFSLEPETALRLLAKVPDTVLTIAAGDIHTHEQTSALFAGGARAVLLGAAMITASDRKAKARELLKGPT